MTCLSRTNSPWDSFTSLFPAKLGDGIRDLG